MDSNKLREIPLFERMKDEQLASVVESAEARTFSDVSVVIEAGNPGVALYVILDGAAQVFFARDGEETVLAELGAGDFFGEMALLDGQTASASVRTSANESTTLLILEKKQFLEIIRSDPSICLALLAAQSERIRAINMKYLEAIDNRSA